MPYRPLSLISRCAALLAGCAVGLAHALQPVADEVLSQVRAGDGLSFNVYNFQVSGDATLTYYAPAPSTASISWGNLFASRSDDPLRPYSDPYRLDIVGRPGLADMFTLSAPLNPDAAARWQVAFDWNVNADGVNASGGTVMLRDLVLQGGGWQWSTPVAGDGVAWGYSLRMDIGDLMLQPRGRDANGWTDPTLVPEQLRLNGVHVGAATADGSAPTQPWAIADATNQPGIFNVVADPAGTPRLRVGIGWPQNGTQAPTGMLVIDNVTFQSDVTGNLNLGSSRIGGMQIQYLDVRFKP